MPLPSMLVKAALPAFAVTLLCCGFVLNALQLLALIVLSPFSRVLYIKTSAPLANCVGRLFVWFLEWGGQCRLKIHSEVPLEELNREHSALVTWNHVNSLDWLVVACFMLRIGKCSSLRTLVKQSLAYVPILGWTWYFSDFIFLKRKLNEDEQKIKQGLRHIRAADDGDAFGRMPFWVTMFCEGTRQTAKNLKESQDWQREKGMEPMKHCLYPRTKGFLHAWKGLGDKTDCIYDVTIGYPKTTPKLSKLCNGNGCDISILIRRVKKDGLETDDDVKNRIVDTFRSKDKVLERYYANETFAHEAPTLYGDHRRQLRSFVIPLVLNALVHATLVALACAYLAPQTAVYLAGFYGATILASAVLL